MTDSRLPTDYSVPQAAGNYTKLSTGTTKLRVLSAPILWRLDWKDEDGKRKPLRYPMDKKPTTVYDKNGIKHFWAFKVYNYDTDKIQIREVSQKSIMNQIKTLLSDEDYRDIYSYDLKVAKEWEKMETKYSILPGKASPLAEEIKQQMFDTPVDLNKLYSWEDPFAK